MSKRITLADVTADEIARNARYGLTRYSADDATKIYAVACELEIVNAATSELEAEVITWLDKNAPDWNTLYVGYEVKSAVELGAYINSYGGLTGGINCQTGGSELYPLTTWKKWIKEYKKYQAELNALWECAQIDMISQAVRVNWWAD